MIDSWGGQPKGLKQLLLERGLIDLQSLGLYTKNGPKLPRQAHEARDRYDENLSLVELIKKCKDFMAERSSILEFIGDAYSIEVLFTPKYHCELAGEGIEYAWGYAKCIYRNIHHSDKNTLAKFQAAVKGCLSRAMITEERCRRFSRRARRYICSYYVFHEVGEDLDLHVKLDDIERMVKLMKTHRCALDFDKKFIKTEVDNGEKSQRLQKLFSAEESAR